MAAFAKIDKAMNMYYRALGKYDYYNDEGIGKFIEYCDDNGLDNADIDEELDDPSSCMYVEFDEEGFPFTDKYKDKDQDAKARLIFDIIKSCYQKGEPPDEFRPKKKNITKKQTADILVVAYLRDIAKKCVDTDGKPVITPIDIGTICTSFYQDKYGLMAPYDFNMGLDTKTIVEAEKIFSNIYMYHSKGSNKADWEPLAIGYANKGYPWLLYVLESYDRDRIRRGCKPEKGYLKLKDWLKECDFINEYILQELEKKSLFESIEKVCIFYIRKWKNEMRVLPSKLEMERMYIDDDLYEITDIILAVYQFVKELYSQYDNGTKFQCEFSIGVRSTVQEVLTTQMVPEGSEPDDTNKYSHHDKVGEFVRNMKENKIPYAHEKVQDRSKFVDYLHRGWKQFKGEIESGKYEERPSTFGDLKTDDLIKKYYSPFPTRRRFCCFIDRRKYYHRTSFRKQLRQMGGPFGMMDEMGGRGMMRGMKGRGMGGMMGLFGMGMYEWVRTDKKIERNPKVDEVTFFIPDDQYLGIEDGDPLNGIYPESYMNIMHTSMIPELRIYDDQREDKHLATDRINGITSNNGSMFNLQFQCERYDEIRMYIHWANQCIRLHPQDFWLVLPRLFVKEYKNNAKYPNDPKVKEKIIKNFKFGDKYFEYFYKYISVYSQQKKEWIDKPTEIKYVN